MPHYYFDIKNGRRHVDPSGLACIDDNDAIAKAKVIALQVGLDVPSRDSTRHIVVLNDAGDEVSKVPIANVPEAHLAS